MRLITTIIAIMVLTASATAEQYLIPDPCKILPKNEIEKIVQAPLKDGRFSDDRSSFEGLKCRYLPAKMFENEGAATITIDTTASMKATDSAFSSAKEEYEKKLYAHKEALKRQHRENEFTPVEGVGDRAFFTDPSLTVLYGDYHIVVRASGGPKITAKGSEEFDKKTKARKLELAKKLAQEVIDKLSAK